MKNRRKLLCFILSSLAAATMAFSVTANAAPAPQTSPNEQAPKYIFLFIGDGMSFPQAVSLGVYRGTIDHNFVGTAKKPTPQNPPTSNEPVFTKFPILGAAKTYDASKFVTDSAAAATAIATGHKALDGGLGVDAFNNKVPSIAELLKTQRNYKIGIVTNVSIDHATPAGFYAHQPHRNAYYDVGLDLIKSDFDYFGGGGFKKPTGNDGKQPHLIELAQQQGYKFINSKTDFMALKPSKDKVLAINAILDNAKDMALEFNIDKTKDDLSLADYTRKGIELLNNDIGFFMMVEGGKIDWASHANDAASMIHDVISLEDAVNVALEFYDKYPNETLIIVTGDHETGGFSIGFGATAYDTYFDVVTNQKISYAKYAKDYVVKYRNEATPYQEVLNDLEPLFGLLSADSPKAKDYPRNVLSASDLTSIYDGYLKSMVPYAKRPYTKTPEYMSHYSYSDHEPLQIAVTRILNNKAGMGWTTTAHTGLPVAVYAKGVGQESFSGFYDNTDIALKLQAITGVTP